MMQRISGLAIAIAAAAFSHDVHGKPATIQGAVVDTGCYVSHDSKGESHSACAAACAKKGVPLAILDEKGILYLPIAVEHQDPNAKLMPFIEKRVKVTGIVLEKDGLKGIAIKGVEALP